MDANTTIKIGTKVTTTAGQTAVVLGYLGNNISLHINRDRNQRCVVALEEIRTDLIPDYTNPAVAL